MSVICRETLEITPTQSDSIGLESFGQGARVVPDIAGVDEVAAPFVAEHVDDDSVYEAGGCHEIERDFSE